MVFNGHDKGVVSDFSVDLSLHSTRALNIYGQEPMLGGLGLESKHRKEYVHSHNQKKRV
jgi:hypothetical protein